jgi:transposase-like protein
MDEEITKCPRCGSANIKKSGPFALIKKEGEAAATKPEPAKYHCWDCSYDWVDKENKY